MPLAENHSNVRKTTEKLLLLLCYCICVEILDRWYLKWHSNQHDHLICWIVLVYAAYFFFAFCTHIQNNISAVIIDFAFGARINYILIINDIYILLYTVLPKILTRYQLLCNIIVLLHCEQKQIKLLYATMEIIFFLHLIRYLFTKKIKNGNWVANDCVNFIDFWISNKFVIFLLR